MDLGCYIQDGFQSVATSALDQLQQAVTQGALNTLNAMTFWLRPDTPALGTQQGDTWTNGGTVEFLQSNLLSVTAAVFAVAVLVAGMRIAWEQRARPLQDLLKAILTFVVVGAAGTATLQVLSSWSDGFSVYLLDQVAGGVKLTTAFGGTSPHELFAAAMPGFVAMMTGLAVIAASAVQIVLMLIRSAMLVLLAGAFPLAAAATNTEIGRNWFKKFCGWSLAFIAYKPAAALVYAAAMKMGQEHPSSTSDAVVRAMGGMMMLLLAIFALPALMRFMVPVTAAAAGGSAGMGSSLADPGGMATGAINIGSSGAGFGSGRGAGSSAGASGGGGGAGGGGAGGGATGAQAVGAKAAGAKAAGAIAGPAGIGLGAARKLGGSVAGAAAHSAGESGGGAITPPSASGPMAGRSGARSARAGQRATSSQSTQHRTPEPAGPSGGW
ncbi:hypothetical protein ACIA58_07385 [Kribbella sp. NPDC051586]|uniref:hypothetical protein n=1 Tax=Kribbella sp. NPDC051586 TaxID=3364118 RepID=UPI00379F906A